MWPFDSIPSTSHSSSQEDPLQRSCPIDHQSRKHGDRSLQLVQEPQTNGSSKPDNPSIHRLSTEREVSSIPRYRPELNDTKNRSINPSSNESKTTSDFPAQTQSTTTACPIDKSKSSDDQNNGNWVYPSPSQFYDALRRKNHRARSSDMYTIVPIHNAVNERVWNQVLEWEANYGRGSFDRWPRSGKSGPMLCSFRGRPNDLSPRAWIKVLSGYQAPFDRHDWEVVRPTEERMRYVIDFYPGRGTNGLVDSAFDKDSTTNTHQQSSPIPNLSFHLDVRPAIDNWEGLRMRILRSWDEFRQSFSSSSSTTTTNQPPTTQSQQS